MAIHAGDREKLIASARLASLALPGVAAVTLFTPLAYLAAAK